MSKLTREMLDARRTQAKMAAAAQTRTVLICAVRRHETGTLKKLILEKDEHAFMMISNINEVFGHNFKRLGQ